MSYLVLARKWRPQLFSDLIGQEHVSRTLQNAIEIGRVAHAFIFTGARGVGKTSAARILAKTLVCENGPSTEPCNNCPACNEITAGTAVDVIEIDGASNNGVDDVRELRDNVSYLPSRLRLRIIIIDEVHMLSNSAFNALLKTLEEPPSHVKFIFATTEPQKLPITILSRCQRFDFRRIDLPTIVARLRFIVDQEEVLISDSALAMIARKGDGSMRDSLSTLDQVLAFCGNTVADDDVVAILGVVDRRLLLAVSAAVLENNSRAVLEIVKQVDSSGYNIRQFCQELLEHFRVLTLSKALGEISDLTDLSAVEMDEIADQSVLKDLSDFQRYVSILLKAESEMGHTGFPRLLLEMTLLRMTTLAPAIPVEELLSRLDSIRGAVSSGTVASPLPQWGRQLSGSTAPLKSPSDAIQKQSSSEIPKKANADTKAADSMYVSSGNKDWQGFVEMLRKEKPMLGTMLEHAYPVVVTSELLEIGFLPGSFEYTTLNSPATLAEITQFAGKFFKADTVVRLKVLHAKDTATNSIADTKIQEAATRDNELSNIARSNPSVQAALEVFGGELLKVEPVN